MDVLGALKEYWFTGAIVLGIILWIYIQIKVEKGRKAANVRDHVIASFDVFRVTADRHLIIGFREGAARYPMARLKATCSVSGSINRVRSSGFTRQTQAVDDRRVTLSVAGAGMSIAREYKGNRSEQAHRMAGLINQAR